jgi:uncharacterized protein
VITFDTSGLLGLLDPDEADAPQIVAAVRDDPGPLVVPAGILAEVASLLEHRYEPRALDAFLADLEDGAFVLDCGEGDVPRIRELVDRYADLPLRFADAAVIACAERSGGSVMTLDRRGFDIVARDVHLTVLPM